MKTGDRKMDFAIEVFVRGHSTGKSRTFPYEASRVGPLWVMRDAARRNPRNYRKEEWIAMMLTPRRWTRSHGGTHAGGSLCARWSATESRMSRPDPPKGPRLSASGDRGLLRAAVDTDSEVPSSRVD
jgi:hypothetical protein